MCTHYICGINECKNFAQVIYMSQEISKLLPFFKYEVLSMKKDDYEEWYTQFFKVNKLNPLPLHTSPVVWREWLGEGKNKIVDLIGGFSNFLEFCKECLHVESLWTPKQVEALSNKVLKNSTIFPQVEGFCICIVGGGHPATRLLILELISNAESIFKKNLHIMLCDCTCSSNEKMNYIEQDFMYLQEEHIVEVVPNLDMAMKQCQLLIITKQIDRKKYNMLSTYFDFMVDMADLFVKHSRKSCRILLAFTDYSCFNASAFMREYVRATGKQYLPNIAAVTSHLAIQGLLFLKHATSLPMEMLFGTPVWGFVGENEGLVTDYLSTKFTRMKKMLIVPEGLMSIDSNLSEKNENKSPSFEFNKEADGGESREEEEEEEDDDEKESIGSVEKDVIEILLHGIDSDKLRHEYVQVTKSLMEVEYKLRNVNEWLHLQKDLIFFMHERDPILSQVNATIDLLKFWYKEETSTEKEKLLPKENVMFAGVPTDGSFGMKPGLVLSQPVILQNGYLVPYADYAGPCIYPRRKLDAAYNMIDSFGLYWDYGRYETDLFLKKLWLEFGDTLMQQCTGEKAARLEVKEKDQIQNATGLKSRIKACLKEQKEILKELNELSKLKEENNEPNIIGEINAILESQSDNAIENNSSSKHSKDEKDKDSQVETVKEEHSSIADLKLEEDREENIVNISKTMEKFNTENSNTIDGTIIEQNVYNEEHTIDENNIEIQENTLNEGNIITENNTKNEDV